LFKEGEKLRECTLRASVIFLKQNKNETIVIVNWCSRNNKEAIDRLELESFRNVVKGSDEVATYEVNLLH